MGNPPGGYTCGLNPATLRLMKQFGLVPKHLKEDFYFKMSTGMMTVKRYFPSKKLDKGLYRSS